jgi:hypothetical protein
MKTLTKSETTVRKYAPENMAVLAINATNPDVLWFLSQNVNPEIRAKVAGNTYATPEILAALSQDILSVRMAIANNPSTPASVLDSMFSSHVIIEDIAIASNRSLSEELARRIFTEGSVNARTVAAKNPALLNYPSIASVVRNDPAEAVREAFASNAAIDFFPAK